MCSHRPTFEIESDQILENNVNGLLQESHQKRMSMAYAVNAISEPKIAL